MVDDLLLSRPILCSVQYYDLDLDSATCKHMVKCEAKTQIT